MDKQFKIYSVNFRAFYTEKELKINEELLEIFNNMHSIESYYKFITKYKIDKTNLSYDDYIAKKHIQEKEKFEDLFKAHKEIESEWNNKLRKLTLNERKKEKKYKATSEIKVAKELANKDEQYIKLKKQKFEKNNALKNLLSEFEGIRVLNKDLLTLENEICLFDNALSRCIGIECDVAEVNMDIICITISHYDVMEQLINNGFIYTDDKYNTYKYRVLTSSAGQIRKKKIVFIKEEVWNKYSYSIMCGLSWNRINKLGGMNVNKFLAYLALQNSATDEFKKFNIDECIVVNDFETVLKNRDVDFIEKKIETKQIKNKKTEETTTVENLVIKNPVKMKKDITIMHTDGCGMCLEGNKSYQIRLPFIKGLMTPVDYLSFCEETEGATTKIIDLWGKEWDVKKDNIKYIFTKSQFKMIKYYENIYINKGDKIPFIYGWEVYKACFKAYNCKANYCNMEENKDKFRKGQFNYQYWQTLSKVSDKDIEYFTNPIIEKVNKCHNDIHTMLEVFGATNRNNKMNIEQKILYKYPVLLKDFHFQDALSSKLSKIKKEAKCGKFKTHSINTFLLPDIYAWLENLFCKIEVPNGLLNDGEVCCQYFNDKNELLLDRSPHLFLEHSVRKNVNSDNCKDENKQKLISKYFKTNGIYTSTKDLISKVLQCDFDGDKALVTSDYKLINIAKEHCKDIIPLYYDMSKAGAELINTKSIINSLQSAFKYGNIGTYSNKITNLWNRENFDKDTFELIKLLTAMNNYSIDSAKTLEMVDFGEYEKKLYKELLKDANGKMPYFFQFAKDKDKNSVNNKTDSTVNRICNQIETKITDNYEYDFSKLGKFYYKYLLNKSIKSIDIESESSKYIIKMFKKIDLEKNILFQKAKNNNQELEKTSKNIYRICKNKFIEYLKEVNISFEDSSDILIKYFFTVDKQSKKSFLLDIFGEIILNNLNNNLKNKSFGFCIECGCKFEKKTNKQIYCEECSKEKEKEKTRERVKKYRESLKM